MKKYGWNWSSEEALDAYKLILVESAFCHGNFGGSEDLASFLGLADEIVRLERRLPDSFNVAVDLGSIYSAAAVSNARDVKVSDEFIAKAHEAWCVAATHLEKGMPKDGALLEPGPLRAAYVGGYLQILCEISFARYLQTDCTDVSHLRALKKYWKLAKQERPDHPVLETVGKEIDKKLGPEDETEQTQEGAPLFLPGIEQSAPEPPRQGRRRLMVGAVVAIAIAMTGLTYVYRTMDGPQISQQSAPTGPVQSSSDERIPSAPETDVTALSIQRQAIAPGDPGDKEPKTVSFAGESAVAVPTPQDPYNQYPQDGNLLQQLERQIRTRAKTFLAPYRDIPTSVQAVYSVTLTSSGQVEALTLTKSSGHAGFDQSVREALMAAQPYPRVGELLRNGASRTVIVAMKAERPLPPTRKAQGGVPRTAPAVSQQHALGLQSDT